MSAMIDDDDVSLPSGSEDENKTEEVDKEVVTDLSDTKVVTKYLEASRIANLALSTLIPHIVAGASVLDLIEIGETIINKSLSKIYNKKEDGKDVQKGIAFPVCLSVNERICNFSPLKSESDSAPPLSASDVVKIDLGCHIDGYIACTAHTVVVPSAAGQTPVLPDPEMGTVGKACYDAMSVAAALIKPGNTNTMVTSALAKVGSSYGLNFIANVRMHQMKHFVIDGSKEIALCNPDVEAGEERVAECTFEENEVYCIDVAMSTGTGKGREGNDRTTVFKRNVDQTYKLKMKASKYVLNQIQKDFPTMPFSLRMVPDERQAKMGVTECVSHNLLSAYPVFNERDGAYVAHFKTTVLVMSSGTKKVTGQGLDGYYVSEKGLDEENEALLKEVREAEEKKKAKAAAKKKKKKAKK
mmetsp:Transcript_18272/g.33958  ORF Transcript_18272/g.33958 Transcript_18272/m.33958 type:complete len:413 (+) Transcript_18272:38-1276(+)|eukprot:CAMPEP_0182497336 /NCGR_PEP_ID=MMETSP1321-20130603/5835_1 /TAXON_ID=91990 /ORGANISM="Bolidomonas sp., Strain RCC1657" /LENGTH=412 /DNA_ID=CAMNT_0024701183 /DNA_START=17 /DNA_END=1255 /DNA_ORIENTATION=-